MKLSIFKIIGLCLMTAIAGNASRSYGAAAGWLFKCKQTSGPVQFGDAISLKVFAPERFVPGAPTDDVILAYQASQHYVIRYKAVLGSYVDRSNPTMPYYLVKNGDAPKGLARLYLSQNLFSGKKGTALLRKPGFDQLFEFICE